MTATLRFLSGQIGAATESASRTRTIIASTSGVDRYNTTISASGWVTDSFVRNPLLLWGHNRSQPPIGKVNNLRVEGENVVGDAEFMPADMNPFADRVLQMLDFGVLAVSVGFEPLEYTYNAARETGDEIKDWFYPPLDYTRQELHEVSIVTVPGNADALPTGRSLETMPADARARLEARLRARFAGPTPPSAPPKKKQPTADDLRALIARVVKNEARAAIAKARGDLGGTRR